MQSTDLIHISLALHVLLCVHALILECVQFQVSVVLAQICVTTTTPYLQFCLCKNVIKWKHAVCDPMRLTFSLSITALKSSLCVFIVLLMTNISRCRCTSVHSPIEGHLSCFQCWAFTNKTSMNIHVQVLFGHMFSFLWDKYPGVRSLDCMVRVMFSF